MTQKIPAEFGDQFAKQAMQLSVSLAMAEESISSCEIENGPMEPSKRFRMKMQLMFPTLSKKELDIIEKIDREEREKEAKENGT